MPRRKKHSRLPNGYGSIRYLGKNRKNPYAVHPPANIDGDRPAALCYVDDWMKGFIILTAYKAGTYKPGMEKDLQALSADDKGSGHSGSEAHGRLQPDQGCNSTRKSLRHLLMFISFSTKQSSMKETNFPKAANTPLRPPTKTVLHSMTFHGNL